MPRVTYFIPAYNAESTLPAAINSALAQQGASLEVIIVDDGSTDRTLRVAQVCAARDGRVTALTQANAGTAAAANRAILESRGALLVRLDADDELLPNHLQTMLAFMSANPGYDIYSHGLLEVYADGSTRDAPDRGHPFSLSLIDLIQGNRISGAGTVLRRRMLERIGGYRDGVYNEDYDLWIRSLAAGARHIHNPTALYSYRRNRAKQKSGQLAATYESDISILEDLLSTERLSKREERAARRSIADLRYLLQDAEANGGWTRLDAAEASFAALSEVLESTLGRSGAKRILCWLRRMRPVVRPIWGAWLSTIVKKRQSQ